MSSSLSECKLNRFAALLSMVEPKHVLRSSCGRCVELQVGENSEDVYCTHMIACGQEHDGSDTTMVNMK
jgi:hypothetical protein